MTPREAKSLLDVIKPKLVGRIHTDDGSVPADTPGATGFYNPPSNESLAKAIQELIEIVEWMLAEQETERVKKGGF
jgi:hypothetical protein